MKILTYALFAGTLVAAGTLSQARAQGAPDRIFQQADSNGDGLVSEAEFRALRSENWSRFDRNGDGLLTGEDAPRAGGRLHAALSDRLQAFDANGDGVISQAEYLTGPVLAFDTADANGDGLLNTAEFEAAIDAVRGR